MWAFAVVPFAGLLELFAHAVQIHSVPTADDWRAARDLVAAHASPADLVAFAPRWTEPLGLMYFGPEIMTADRVERPDATRFPRAFEVSIRGQHLQAFEAWRRVEEHRFGRVTVT